MQVTNRSKKKKTQEKQEKEKKNTAPRPFGGVGIGAVPNEFQSGSFMALM